MVYRAGFACHRYQRNGSEHVKQDYQRAVQAGAGVLEPIKVNPLANHLEFWLREPNGYVVVVAGPYGQLGAFAENAV